MNNPLSNPYTTHLVSQLSFQTYSSERIKSYSVKEITNPTTFDVMGSVQKGGLHDPALGKFQTLLILGKMYLQYVCILRFKAIFLTEKSFCQ